MKKVATVASLATVAMLSTPFIAEASANNYEVKKGDSLYSIAQKHGLSVTKLKQLNSLSSDLIFPKQKLIVSDKSNETSSVTVNNNNKNSNNNRQEKTYEVVSGDTLIKIANDHGITLAELRSWNNISGHIIYPGQKFIVSKAKTETNDQVNSSPNNNKETSENNSNIVNRPSTDTASKGSYKIKRGDTLSKIARQFGLSVRELKKANNLTSDLIFPGQTLTISKSEQIYEDGTVNNAFAETLVTNAKKHLGAPYLYGGSTPEAFDCSGFIYYVFNESNKKVGRYSTTGYYDRSYYVDKPEIGDLVFFENTYKKGISHMGIYIGDNKFIHSDNSGVNITDLNNSYYKQKFSSFKRFY